MSGYLHVHLRPARYYPHSIVRAMVVAFCILLIPLLVTAMMAAAYVERITAENQQAIVRATNVVRNNQQLLTELGNMERTAGIYEIVGGKKLLDTYRASRKHFYQTVGTLHAAARQDAERQQIDRLKGLEQQAFDTLRQLPHTGRVSALIAQFEAMRTIAQGILTRSTGHIDRELDSMQTRSARVRHLLWLAAISSLPVAGLLCLLVIITIIRPLRSVERRIQALASGQFAQPIDVHGPHDIERLGTQLEWLRTRLQALEATKQTFLQHVSHELKTPLTNVREGAGVLADGVVGDLTDEQREVTQIIANNALLLQHRIESLLDFSAAQTQHVTLHRAPTRLDRLVRRTVVGQSLAAVARRIRIDQQLAPVVAEVDTGKIRTVLDNLLSNAIKYSPATAPIMVALCATDQEALLDIQDRGPGVSSEHRQHLFEPFYRGRPFPTKARQVSGSGLGLSIALEYIKAHGGRIEILESNEGAHFRVHLPLHAT
ncbi:MAG TPA: HAMP domain-containing sensor histidine kinase [Nevskiaceae bacterium]|nr:HAMP domain-containing sensor histidine kinase [Nevskiaceae bacterium]